MKLLRTLVILGVGSYVVRKLRSRNVAGWTQAQSTGNPVPVERKPVADPLPPLPVLTVHRPVLQ